MNERYELLGRVLNHYNDRLENYKNAEEYQNQILSGSNPLSRLGSFQKEVGNRIEYVKRILEDPFSFFNRQNIAEAEKVRLKEIFEQYTEDLVKMRELVPAGLETEINKEKEAAEKLLQEL